MTVMVVDVFRRVSMVLQDTTKVRWTSEELLDWLNDAQKEIVLQRPDANVVNQNFSCEGGSSKQKLPESGLRLFDVIRNVGGSNEPITLIDRATLDTTIPTWHTSAPTDDIENYVYDDRYPKYFYLYPRPAEGAVIEIAFPTAPDEIVVADFEANQEVIGLDDIYQNTIIDYMLYRCYAKETDAQNMNLSAVRFNSFANSLGLKTKIDMRVSPAAQG